jgi:hypothetical protein
LLVHPSTASRTAAREQMGCSNAYARNVVGNGHSVRRQLLQPLRQQSSR